MIDLRGANLLLALDSRMENPYVARIMSSKICVIIPARLSSSRFYGKVLWNFRKIPMIEHVYRRASLAISRDHIYITSGDKDILDYMGSIGANVIKSKKVHNNGTSRAAEASINLPYKYVIILQADEILVEPAHLTKLINSIIKDGVENFYNLITSSKAKNDLYDVNIVKCFTDKNNFLNNFFRTPENTQVGVTKVSKVIGIMAFRKTSLLNLSSMEDTSLQTKNSIEQFKIIEHGFNLKGILVDSDYPSINTESDIALVESFIKKSLVQKKILSQYVNQ
jgi:3-deoxy-manno-octulosonate cytidylyltransferase (CMP-KDO synthetase)